MCDILVLSAMSLSSGGFSEVPENSVKPLRVITRREFEEGRRRFSEVQKEVELARNAVALAKAEAENAMAERDEARHETEQARKAEAQAKTEAEIAMAERDKARNESEQARNAESLAMIEAESAIAERDKAQNEAEQARNAERLAKADAKSALAERDKARNETEQARNAETLAKSEAENAMAERDKARNETEMARNAEAEAKSKLKEMHRRQDALSGIIPHDFIWKLTIQFRTRKGTDTVVLFSPLVTIDGIGFLLFERSWLKNADLEDIVSIMASRDDVQIWGKAYAGSGELLFVNLGDVSRHPHISFGVERMNLDNNLVFYPKDGSISGNPVPCYGSGSKISCSVKTEARTFFGKWRGDYSVNKGCFLISNTQGSITAIVRGEPSRGRRECAVLHPTSVTNILTTAKEKGSQ